MVLATVTVTDRNGRYRHGTRKENFKLAEDKVPQEIAYFSSEDIPLSVGIILDVSGSMKDKLKTAVEAAITFMKGGSPDDEYFLVEFADKPTDTADFTNDIAKIQSRSCLPRPKAGPPFMTRSTWDSQSSKQGNNAKRALLLITDGEDNRSRYTFSNVREFVKEKDVQMYAIGITNGWSDASAEQGRALLRDLAAISGGNSFFPTSVYRPRGYLPQDRAGTQISVRAGLPLHKHCQGWRMAQDQSHRGISQQQTERSRKAGLLRPPAIRRAITSFETAACDVIAHSRGHLLVTTGLSLTLLSQQPPAQRPTESPGQRIPVSRSTSLWCLCL